MAEINLYTSNRVEVLIQKLTDILTTYPIDPMVPEIIVIPSHGMERYISYNIAQTFHICAHCHFPFPNTFVQYISKLVFLDIDTQTLFEPKNLLWKIMSLLPKFFHTKGFETLTQYCAADASKIKTYQISKKIADVFDQYTVFRPELIRHWESGKRGTDPDEWWQATLWQQLTQNNEPAHRLTLRDKLYKTLKKNEQIQKRLPSRISLFGFSYLSPFHIDMVKILAPYSEINLFALNPCLHFWDDIVSEKQHAKLSRHQYNNKVEKQLNLHYEVGNSLLSSLGMYGKEFFQALHSVPYQEHDAFVDPGEKNLLSTIQSDILNLRTHVFPVSIPPSDDSLHIHICHSALREMEVLKDNVLSFFDNDATLRPEDIIIMTPDIEKFVPHIHTVFDHPDTKRHRIPFTIADVSPSTTDQIINVFFSILDVSKNRFSASSILSILESEIIQKSLDISADDWIVIQTWVEETHIRWGIDRKYRKKLGLPATHANTWKAGFEQLILGYAMGNDQAIPFQDIIPSSSLNETQTELFAKFNLFVNRIFSISEQLTTENTISHWANYLLSLCSFFFSHQETDAQSIEIIRHGITGLFEQETIADFHTPIPFAPIHSYLESVLYKKNYGRGYLQGGITFCTMLPMRSIPFRIICLIGMNDRDFPRANPSLAFDLLVKKPRPGDRSFSKEDRFCFLETILSARQKLYISYRGHNLRDNSTLQPSILVSELLDYIRNNFCLESKRTKKNLLYTLTTDHRLSACNPVYFSNVNTNNRYFSYSNEYAEAANSEPIGKKPFFTTFLPLPHDDEWKTTTLENFYTFFRGPTQFFMSQRLGILFPEPGKNLSDSEPFTLEGLDKYKTTQRMLMTTIGSEKTYLNTIDHVPDGTFPHGKPGVYWYRKIQERVELLTTFLNRNFIKSVTLHPIDISVSLFEYNLTARLHFLSKEFYIFYKPSSIKPKDKLRLWLIHLMINIQKNESLPKKCLLLGIDNNNEIQCFQFEELTNPKDILYGLFRIYEKGLVQPLPFYPMSSYAYASALVRGKNEEYAKTKAQEEWLGNTFKKGECQDPYLRLCHGNDMVINEAFKGYAQEIFNPILTHEKRVYA